MAKGNVLQPLIENISEKITDIKVSIKELLGEVKKVNKTVKKGINSLRNAIYENIEAQAEMKLMDHMAKIHGIRPQIEAENEQISMEKDELEDKLQKLTERYSRKQSELNKKAEKRIRELGEHIFEIQEEEYEDNIEISYTSNIFPIWEEIKEHNDFVSDHRHKSLENELDMTKEEIENFKDERPAVVEKIQKYKTDFPGKPTDEELVRIPYWVVEVKSGESIRKVIIDPSDLRTDDEKLFKAEIESKGLKSYLKKLNKKEIETKVIKEISGSEIASNLNEFTKNQFGPIPNFAQALETTLKDNIKIKEEK
ncbi:MAG: hypothetical protein BTN85_2016 [Candidatus Methanohalarchaeum thermophilum]|uniref:Uncharacterized protein n=1 Tax=Methanohalarchaeum thermophilum TaxID=1903181 RepID=A0A1Q6DSL9_METT1|nr:MAG: hypothetical protein BTN85_2016 [Candidatus Methanohalarchaeum thermophilum]